MLRLGMYTITLLIAGIIGIQYGKYVQRHEQSVREIVCQESYNQSFYFQKGKPDYEWVYQWVDCPKKNV